MPMEMVMDYPNAKIVKQLEAGDELARRQLVKLNLNFILEVLNPYLELNIPLIRLIEITRDRISLCLKDFNPQKGLPFLSYVKLWLKHDLYENISARHS